MFGYVFFDYGLHEFYEFLPCEQNVDFSKPWTATNFTNHPACTASALASPSSDASWPFMRTRWYSLLRRFVKFVVQKVLCVIIISTPNGKFVKFVKFVVENNTLRTPET